MLVTPTASGKSLGYNLPVLDGLLKDGDAKALYLFPTKALSQDQVKTLGGFQLEDLRLYIYDGDTPSSIRQAARRNGRLITARQPRRTPSRTSKSIFPRGSVPTRPL